VSKRRKNAGEGYGYMFSGAFAKKADAVKKEKSRKGSFIKTVWLKSGMRYAVMTPRTNPRKKRAKKETKAQVLQRRLAEQQQHDQDRYLAERARGNPSELIVMGANPLSPQKINLPPGSTITIRTNPIPRENVYFGFGPAPTSERLTVYRKPRGIRSRSGGSRESLGALRADVASALVNQGYKLAQARRMARTASGSDFSSMFNEALRSNPMCEAMIGGYPCTRKPGHKGPHLPRGATMRTQSRLPHEWKPRDNPSAEALREKFKGGAVDKVVVANEPHMPRGDYAMIGKKIVLYVKPRAGGQVQQVDLEGSMAVADETARQIYFVGGDQDISSGLHVFGALDRGAGLFELGEARRIDYEQLKEHEYWLPENQRRWWKHPFGEETGVHPRVLFDATHKRLLLEGGEYVVRAEGIVN